jgi:hypothetical protein
MRFVLVACVAASIVALPAQAEVIRSKHGAHAVVSSRAAPKFRRLIEALEKHGASIRFMGGIRSGWCAPPRHKHPCGLALDVCQLGRDVVDRRCRLPGRSVENAIAEDLDLISGGSWRFAPDRGHFEL